MSCEIQKSHVKIAVNEIYEFNFFLVANVCDDNDATESYINQKYPLWDKA